MKYKVVILLLANLIFANLVVADTPKAVTTFECISIYWTPSDGSVSKDVLVQYRVEGSSTWSDGLEMKYQPIAGTNNELATYRGSLVNLTPNTTYEIKLTLEGTTTSETISATTWNEDFPIGNKITVGNMSSQLNITSSGTENGYLLIDGSNSIIDVKNKSDYCINITGNYVIIRGFTLKGAQTHGIHLEDIHDVVIEECDISGWGQIDSEGFGVPHHSAIYSSNGSGNVSHLTKIIVQRCQIHHPRGDANSWAEWHRDTYHPGGPEGVGFYNSAGNNVIRYNKLWSDSEHMFNDILGSGSNASYNGFPGSDTDIYGNYLSNCWDDAIECDGANRNVRVWGNFIENVFMPISNTPTTIGPLYIWKNTSGKSNTPPGSQVTGQYSAFIKMGYAKSRDWMKGFTYLFNNTVLQPQSSEGKDDGAGGIGAHYGSDRIIQHCVTRNNILHVRKYDHSIAIRDGNVDLDFDYDLCNKKYPDGHEAHGIDGTPIYIDGASFDYTNMTANFFLNDGSPGVDAGEIIPNFIDQYEGSAPDMGAFEAGQAPMEYGVKAYLITDIKGSNFANLKIPSDFYLLQNYPNPFNPTTVISYGIPTSGLVTVKVFNILGERVATLVNGYKNAGSYKVDFNASTGSATASHLPSGMYIYSIKSGNYVSSKKMLFIK